MWCSCCKQGLEITFKILDFFIIYFDQPLFSFTRLTFSTTIHLSRRFYIEISEMAQQVLSTKVVSKERDSGADSNVNGVNIGASETKDLKK